MTIPASDFAAINRAALPRLEALCARWLPGGRRIGAEWTCGSLRGEPGRSCKVNLRTGRWALRRRRERPRRRASRPPSTAFRAEAAGRLARMLGLEVRRSSWKGLPAAAPTLG